MMTKSRKLKEDWMWQKSYEREEGCAKRTGAESTRGGLAKRKQEGEAEERKMLIAFLLSQKKQ